MRTIAITNQKGGSCKTTTAVNLAAALAEQGERLLVVDLDPQGSASSWLGLASEGRGLLDALTSNVHLADLVSRTHVANLEAIAGSRWLTGLDRALANEPGAEVLLRVAIARLPKRWDYVILDCPPSLGLLGITALVAADAILVPVEARVMALAGLASLLNTTDRIRERLNSQLELEGIVACRVDGRTNLSREIVGRLRSRFGATVFDVVIRENVRLAEAPSFQQPITTYATSSTGSEDYRALARELITRQKEKSQSEQATFVDRA